MVGAQARLRDPFVPDPFGLQVADTGGATSRALRAAPILPGWASFARRSIAGTSFIFIRGVTAQSVSAVQTSYFVYQVVREDSVRLAFTAPFREYSGRAPEAQEPESELRACLFMRDTTEVGYLTMPSRTTRYFSRPPLPRSGYYRWSTDRRAFVRRADGDALLRRRCAEVYRIASK